METIIEQVEITRLFNSFDLKVPIVNNRLVLVGENGSGKSTLVSMLFLFLTKQWRKLKEYSFESMTVVISGNSLTVSKDELIISHRSRRGELRTLNDRLAFLNITPTTALKMFSPNIYHQIKEVLPDLSVSRIRNMLERLINEDSLFVDDNDNLSKIESMLNMRVLYLPTFRRIERDLESILPLLEKRYNSPSAKNEDSDVEKKHIELVEFGMEDVLALVSNSMNSLNNTFRNSLSSITGGFLRVVLRKEYKKADTSFLNEMDENDVKRILERIDESVLSKQDREALIKVIQRLNKKKTTTDIDLVSVHIISELIKLHKRQLENEESVRTFASVCNKYLNNKGFIFDSNHFTLPVRKRKKIGDHVYVYLPEEIILSQLSSGEKQIVSLFAHLYLSVHKDYLIIIDEPELSLSVPWQSRFLPDILATGRCSGIIAVTHSPFIYENEFVNNVHSMEEFQV